ncbi:hypothetical protein LEP1GSC058_3811 [Leptospira fainei serovar Hurstbridge str. BUT 6]|uniref:HipA-like kinase domain-containing protein n=1 Tax=Leptospira fainei serovar Hurstbridge str. BUT 6 TaxID=1193011 RepID=S3UV43_9LEPT|nr:HipA family kinase [Leptospira fainei]EPG74271.1 hypothetical protein LEP1GSC058_3811 [Leptospira fainei serovar Hurstbridge str. BUT 6]
METYQAKRVLSSRKVGSSWPLLIETADGEFFLKLSGAGQGYGALISEVISAGIADRLGLNVPNRAFIQVDGTLVNSNEDPELTSLLNASAGLNLGFEYIPNSKILPEDQIEKFEEDIAIDIFWFDWLIENPDRTRNNPNILIRKEKYWLIDHGAALGFQYDFSNLTEDLPKRFWSRSKDHIFYERIHMDSFERVHRENSKVLTLDELEIITWEVPAEFFKDRKNPKSLNEINRKREIFAVYLWKRIKSLESKRSITEFFKG